MMCETGMAGARLAIAPDEARNEKEKASGNESTLGHDWRELSAARTTPVVVVVKIPRPRWD